MPNCLRFALTPGEPAGIGPDLCLLLARQQQAHALVCVASRELMQARAAELGLQITLIDAVPEAWPTQPAPAGSLYVWDTPLGEPVVTGQLSKANAAYVLQTLTPVSYTHLTLPTSDLV